MNRISKSSLSLNTVFVHTSSPSLTHQEPRGLMELLKATDIQEDLEIEFMKRKSSCLT